MKKAINKAVILLALVVIVFNSTIYSEDQVETERYTDYENEIIHQLRNLIILSHDNEDKAFEGILNVVIASKYGGTEEELFRIMIEVYSKPEKKRLERITGRS